MGRVRPLHGDTVSGTLDDLTDALLIGVGLDPADPEVDRDGMSATLDLMVPIVNRHTERAVQARLADVGTLLRAWQRIINKIVGDPASTPADRGLVDGYDSCRLDLAYALGVEL